jgi:hypothetical protein
MMPGAACGDAEQQTGCGGLRQQMDGLLAEYAAVMTAVAGNPDCPDLGRRMTLLTAALRESRAALAACAFTGAYAAEIEARAYQRGREDERAAAAPARAPGRHRRPCGPATGNADRQGQILKLLRTGPMGILRTGPMVKLTDAPSAP